jgi:hypothetical protein
MAGPNTPEGIIKVTQNLPTQMPPEWQISDKGKEAIRIAVGMAQTKHGLAAGVPIICKGGECPFRETCYLQITGMDVPGERCPIEIAAVVKRFDAYMEELDIKEEDTTDMSLLKNLVDIEIQLVRADKKMAADGNIVEDIVVAIGEDGTPYYKPEITRAAEFKMKLLNEHSKILSYLHATRKDKAAEKGLMIIDASTYAAKLLESSVTIDVTPKDEADEDSTGITGISSEQTPNL